MSVKQTALAAAVALTVVGGSALALTSTVNSQFILDKTEITTGSDVTTSDTTINLALLGLDKNGEVDLEGEKDGSIIIAIVETELGKINNDSIHPGVVPNDDRPSQGDFAAELRYIKLIQGNGRVSISYDPEDIGNSVKTDIVKIRLQERVPTANGGVEFIDIGETVEKTITINPPSFAPDGLRIAGFKPSSLDPRGMADCYTETDFNGVLVAEPDSQKNSCENAIFDGIFSEPKIDNGINAEMMAGQAGGQVLILANNPNATGDITLTLSSVHNDAVEPIIISGPMVRGQAIVTLNQSITETHSSKMTYGDYYMKATFEGFEEDSSVQLVYPDILRVWSTGIPKGLRLTTDKKRIALASQGVKLDVRLLDEYGNLTTNCTPTINDDGVTSCATTGSVKVVVKSGATTLLDLSVPANSASGQAMPSTGSNTILDNINKGDYNLVASAVNIQPSNIEKLQVVADSLEVSNVFTAADEVLAGNEFDLALVKIKGSDSNPGSIILTNLDTGESITVNRSDNNFVKGLFENATWVNTRFLVSDAGGRYGEIIVDTPPILPAAAKKVNFENAHGEEIQTVMPNKSLSVDQYIVVLPEVAFKMLDTYGNAISANTGEVTVKTPNASVEYRTPSTSKAVPGRNVSAANYRYSHIALLYKAEGTNAFSGSDVIRASFTKPGLGVGTLDIDTIIPNLLSLGSIVAHIETTDIPVNSLVAMTVETLGTDGNILRNSNTSVTITLGGEADDTLTPKVKSIDEISVETGSSISIEDGREVFIVEAGSRTGQFSIKFADANSTIAPTIVTFNVTEQLISPDATPEEACHASGNIWNSASEKCMVVPSVSGAGSSSGRLTSSGELSSDSPAKFSAGFSLNKGSYKLAPTYAGETIDLASVIQVAADHIGQEVDVLILLGVSLVNGGTTWYQVTVAEEYILLGDDLNNIVKYDTYPTAGTDGRIMVNIDYGTLNGIYGMTAEFFFGYRISGGDGTIYFGMIPTTLEFPGQ